MDRRAFYVIVLGLAGCSAGSLQGPDTLVDSGGPDVQQVDEASDDLGPKPFPPVVPGPASELFDCTVEDFELPPRTAASPIDCPIRLDCDVPMVVGHRGVGGQFGSTAPENSIYAIRAALLLGLDGIELDVRHTVDDELVVIHDTTVDRTTSGTGTVSEMTLEQVTALQLVEPDIKPIIGDFSCARVPTLAEAFALTRDRLFIDLDTKTHRVDLVVAAIVEAGLEDQVFISTGDVDRVVEARLLAPHIRIQIRPDTMEDYLQAKAQLSRIPEIVEIPADMIEAMSQDIIEDGAKVFTDVWGADIAYYADENPLAYLDLYAAGAQILQSELPVQVLEALDRWP